MTQAAAKERWLTGVPADKRAALIPPGWFEHWAGVTWATDPEGQPGATRRRCGRRTAG